MSTRVCTFQSIIPGLYWPLNMNIHSYTVIVVMGNMFTTGAFNANFKTTKSPSLVVRFIPSGTYRKTKDDHSSD